MAFVLSFIAIVLSVLAFYMTHLRQSDIRVRLQPKLHIYHPADGGTALYVQAAFVNHSPTSDVIQDILLKVQERNSADGCFLCSWQEEGELPFRGTTYKQTGVAAPFVVPGNSTVMKTLWFLYINNADPLLFKGTEYDITLYCERAGKKQPGIVTSEILHIHEESAQELAKRKGKKDPTTQIFPFKWRKPISEFSTITDIVKWKLNRS